MDHQRVLDLAATLEGSCEPLPDWVIEDAEACELLDEHVRLCDECGWWGEAGLFDEEGRCDECQAEP